MSDSCERTMAPRRVRREQIELNGNAKRVEALSIQKLNFAAGTVEVRLAELVDNGP